MKKIKIYLEGGGERKEQKAELRNGMTYFLRSIKETAAAKKISLDVVVCGTRGKAHQSFVNSIETGGSNTYPFLLVDSEEPVTKAPKLHLTERDGWSFPDIDEDRIHLMIQTMETWIVADAAAVKIYYTAKDFVECLPVSDNLETRTKAEISKLLNQATKKTQKGEYHKTRHAPSLLARLEAEKVRKRCPSCDRLFVSLNSLIARL